MQQSDKLTYLELRVWTTALASASTAVIIAILSLPIHLMMHAHGMREGWRTSGAARAPGGSMMHAPMSGAGFVGWIFVALLVLIVYSGVAGAIFAATYNALVRKR